MAIEVLVDETVRKEFPNANSIEEAKEALVNDAKFYGASISFEGATSKGNPEKSMLYILPSGTFYRMTVIEKKPARARSSGTRKSKEPELVANQVYVEVAPVQVAGKQKWAFMVRNKEDGKPGKLIEGLRMAIFRETGKGNFYANPYTDEAGETLTDPRWVVSDTHKEEVLAALAEAGIELAAA